MGLFRRAKKGPRAPEHAVIVRFGLSDDEFGSVDERDAIYRLEDELIEVVAGGGVGEVDGHEFGGGEATLYAYGPDADAVFAAIESSLRAFPIRPGTVTLRYGEATDPSAEKRHIEL